MNKYLVNILIGVFCWSGMSACASPKDEAKEIVDIIYKVNNYWQTQNPEHGRSFWDNAAYHSGNMEAFFLTGDSDFMNYSKAWAGKVLSRIIKPNGNTAMARVTIMCFLVITRFVSRRMPIYTI